MAQAIEVHMESLEVAASTNYQFWLRRVYIATLSGGSGFCGLQLFKTPCDTRRNTLDCTGHDP